MAGTIAQLLSKDVIGQAQRLGVAIRDGEVAPLVGAGLSVSCGIPDWTTLVGRLILAWQQWDTDRLAQTLSTHDYVALIRDALGSDLAVISYLRNRLRQRTAQKSKPTFGQLLYAALYSRSGVLFTPSPNLVHRHLVALFATRPGKLWTTNYDDLLEEAGRLAGYTDTRTLDPLRRIEGHGPTVAHVHGFLAPQDRAAPHPRPEDSPVVLSEDDFHSIASDVAGWTNREFNSLFDGHRALILGMSLSDPNVRRVLSAAAVTRHGSAPKHFAIMPTSQETPEERYVSRCRSWYWQQYGVEFVQLPNYESILPFLMRLRYESYGAAPGHLWRDGARICAGIDAWRAARQKTARAVLTSAVAQIKQDFAVTDPSEIIEIGVFLLKDVTTLELTFRGGGVKTAVQGAGGRTFAVDPDNPTGVAGRVFVSSDLVRISRQHALQDYGMIQARPASTDYEGIVSVPVIDWLHGGIPLGVAYLTTRTTDGTIFSLPETSLDATQRSIQDLYVWLHDVAMSLIETFRS